MAAMRDKSHERQIPHQPPSNLSADGMDTWYRQQKEREQELRERRREAEALLRGYRGSYDGPVTGSASKTDHHHDMMAAPSSGRQHSVTPTNGFTTPREGGGYLGGGTTPTSTVSETLDDPTHFKNNTNKSTSLSSSHDEDEKKLDDQQAAQMNRAKNVNENTEEITVWRDFISSAPRAKFPPEAGRYHCYLSFACPGSHRVSIVRALKGLDNVLSITYVHPTWRLTNPNDPEDKHRGWVFGDPNGQPFHNTIGRGGPFPPVYLGNEPDPLFDAYSIREIYEQAQDTSGKYTIPLLWDKKLNTIVNNESSDIAYMLNSCFNDFAKDPTLDLYTEFDQTGMAKLNEVSEWMAPLMIHGVYRCGFAKSQRAYDKAIAELCEAFDRADDILQSQRYLTGDTLTDVDIRLFVTLLRFDEVFAFYFRANARLVMLTPSLLNFCRDIYQMPGVAQTCNMEQIKAHFYGSHAEWNKYSVIPRGLGFMELLDLPHDRDMLSSADDECEGVVVSAAAEVAGRPDCEEVREGEGEV